LARTDGQEGLLFKGGTLLRLCFYEDFRYSADLDFSIVTMPAEGALDVLKSALKLCAETIGLSELELVEEDVMTVRYSGPLGRMREIKVDIASDELVLESTEVSLLRRYPDQHEGTQLASYTLNEATAEKVRCVIQRSLCRDVSDLHRLFVREGVDVDVVWPMFEEKARARGVDPDLFAERLGSRTPDYKARWEEELADLEPGLLPFEQVMRELRRAVRGQLKNKTG
jgi:predicted nucleotidyltransferase component of viral defense system